MSSAMYGHDVYGSVHATAGLVEQSFHGLFVWSMVQSSERWSQGQHVVMRYGCACSREVSVRWQWLLLPATNRLNVTAGAQQHHNSLSDLPSMYRSTLLITSCSALLALCKFSRNSS